MKINIKCALAVLCAGLISSAYATCYIYVGYGDGYACTRIGDGIGTTTFPPCTSTAGIIADSNGDGQQMVENFYGDFKLLTTQSQTWCNVAKCHAINPCTHMTVTLDGNCDFQYWWYNSQEPCP